MNRRMHGFNDSKSYCPETCPDVDGAFANAWADLADLVAPQLSKDAENILDNLSNEVKKVGTERLREALCSAITDKEESDGERRDLAAQVADLESVIDELRAEIAGLESQLEKEEA